MFKLFVTTTCQTEVRTDVIEFEYSDGADIAAHRLITASGKNGVYYTVVKLY